MPTSRSPEDAFRQRQLAESFGVDVYRYDRTRPAYPDDLIDWILADLPAHASAGDGEPLLSRVPASGVVTESGLTWTSEVGGRTGPGDTRRGPASSLQVLDVGIGTGIGARQFRAAGCEVVGVEPDPRMAAFAAEGGFVVDVATFEQWDSADRSFDAVVAGQAWHWVDPDVGAAKAASVLRPGGRLALFWNAGQPAAPAGEAFADVFERLMPGSRLTQAYRSGVSASQGYATFLDKADDAIRATGAFVDPVRWSIEWDHVYTRDEWLDLLPTQGLLTTLPPDELSALSAATGTAIDALGGSFLMRFTTLATAATRVPPGALPSR